MTRKKVRKHRRYSEMSLKNECRRSTLFTRMGTDDCPIFGVVSYYQPRFSPSSLTEIGQQSKNFGSNFSQFLEKWPVRLQRELQFKTTAYRIHLNVEPRIKDHLVHQKQLFVVSNPRKFKYYKGLNTRCAKSRNFAGGCSARAFGEIAEMSFPSVLFPNLTRGYFYYFHNNITE